MLFYASHLITLTCPRISKGLTLPIVRIILQPNPVPSRVASTNIKRSFTMVVNHNVSVLLDVQFAVKDVHKQSFWPRMHVQILRKSSWKESVAQNGDASQVVNIFILSWA